MRKFRWTSVLLDRDVMDDLLNAALLCSDMRLKTLYLSENHFLCIMRPVCFNRAGFCSKTENKFLKITFRTGEAKSRETRTLKFSSNFVAVQVFQYQDKTWSIQAGQVLLWLLPQRQVQASQKHVLTFVEDLNLGHNGWSWQILDSHRISSKDEKIQ